MTFRSAVERHGSAASAFGHLDGPVRRTAAARADEVLERASAAGCGVLVFGEPGYPERLSDLGDPPSALFTLGDAAMLTRRSVAIVGTRHASPSGLRIAHELAVSFSRAGILVVSGMALGIDAAAHRGALDVTSPTVGVLGGGADLPYPPTHAALHRRIIETGLTVSEALPGQRPVKGAFPRRNRIIAALSDLIIVVEAGQRSGALITAGLALDLGRPVAAVPGPIDSPRHVGSNQLLAAGALFISSCADALDMMSLSPSVLDDGRSRREPGVPRSGDEAAVLLAVRRGASDTDGIVRATGLPARNVGIALSTLELSGVLRIDGAGIALDNRPA